MSKDSYRPADDRYDNTAPGWFRRCGRSGLVLPAISLGMWHNFGQADDKEQMRQMCATAFDLGVTHFDLANNYGPPPGSAERHVGKLLRDFPRHELVISTKAGYRMWPGPYGDGGSRKYMIQSLEASLRRLKLDHVDLFYHHRFDPDTPMDETLGALDHAVESGKAIYAGISNYNGDQTRQAMRIASDDQLARPIIHQAMYNMHRRVPEEELFPAVREAQLGVIVFCPLAQGLLTDKYLGGIPDDSRAASATGFLRPEQVSEDAVGKARKLNEIAQQRGQSLAQMALAWVLRREEVTSALIGARTAEQVRENVAAAQKLDFTDDELSRIDAALAG